MKITFEDVENKYLRARKCMEFNYESALHPETNSAKAPWIVHSTLARWLYISSREFFEDFIITSRKLKERNKERDLDIFDFYKELNNSLEQMKFELRNKFSEDKLLMREIST